MGINQSDPWDVDHSKIGTPYSKNKHLLMAKQGKTGLLLKQFQNGLIDCFQIVQPSSGHTLLHQAITLNRRQLFRLCQVYGADWEQGDAQGVTPLMKAAGLNREFFVQRLIELGVKVDRRDPRGRSASDYARLMENFELADRLDQIK